MTLFDVSDLMIAIERTNLILKASISFGGAHMKRHITTALVALGLMPGLSANMAMAQEPFIGEVTFFAGNFAPRGWAKCDGQLEAINTNDALFSILGTIYGGDGRTTFGLPDLRGRIPISAGNGPGLSDYRLGSKGGVENVTLTTNQLGSHTHPAQLKGTSTGADGTSADGGALAESTANMYVEGGTTFDSTMVSGTAASGFNGGGQSHTNIMPFETVNCIIALIGIYPSRQ